jgi:hypothetical protein
VGTPHGDRLKSSYGKPRNFFGMRNAVSGFIALSMAADNASNPAFLSILSEQTGVMMEQSLAAIVRRHSQVLNLINRSKLNFQTSILVFKIRNAEI